MLARHPFSLRIFSHRESMPAHAAVPRRHVEKNKTNSLLLARFPRHKIIKNHIPRICES